MPSSFIKIYPDNTLYNSLKILQRSRVEIGRIKARLDSLVGFPADFTVIASDYGITLTEANTLYNYVTSINTALQASPFSTLANYDQEK